MILQKCLVVLRCVGIVKNTGVSHRHMTDRRVQGVDRAAQAAFARPVQDRRNQTAGEENGMAFCAAADRDGDLCL